MKTTQRKTCIQTAQKPGNVLSKQRKIDGHCIHLAKKKVAKIQNGNFKGITVSKSNADPKNVDKMDYEVDAIAGATITGDGVNISADDITAGRAAYLVCRVNYLRPAAAASWNDIQGLVDFASQVGGSDS